MATQQQIQDFINSIAPYAVQEYNASGILPSITIAQAGIESGWGTSGLSSTYNNLFGIKGKGDKGSVNMSTTEYSGLGVPYSTKANFAVYSSPLASIKAHTEFLTSNSRYEDHGLFNASDYKGQAEALQNAGYATSPTYGNDLVSTIESHDLGAFDKGAIPWTQGGEKSTSYASTPSGSKLALDNILSFIKNSGFVVGGFIVVLLGIYFLLASE